MLGSVLTATSANWKVNVGFFVTAQLSMNVIAGRTVCLLKLCDDFFGIPPSNLDETKT